MADFTVSDDLKLEIIHKFIEPAYLHEVKEAIRGKTCWKKTGQVFETMSKIFVAIGGILSFSSGYYNDHVLSFIAGSVSTISLAMLQFSSFSYRENKQHGDELNIILQKLKLDTIPNLIRGVDEHAKSASYPLMMRRNSMPPTPSPSDDATPETSVAEESKSDVVIDESGREDDSEVESKHELKK
jgi:hypothetical protein